MSSSQLTKSIIFQRVFLLNHQPEKWQTLTNINQQLPTLNQHLTTNQESFPFWGFPQEIHWPPQAYRSIPQLPKARDDLGDHSRPDPDGDQVGHVSQQWAYHQEHMGNLEKTWNYMDIHPGILLILFEISLNFQSIKWNLHVHRKRMLCWKYPFHLTPEKWYRMI